MYELYHLNAAAMQTEVDYRRNQLIGSRVAGITPRGRWWRRAETHTR